MTRRHCPACEVLGKEAAAGWLGVGGSRVGGEAVTQAGGAWPSEVPGSPVRDGLRGRLEDRACSFTLPPPVSPATCLLVHSLPFMFSLPMFQSLAKSCGLCLSLQLCFMSACQHIPLSPLLFLPHWPRASSSLPGPLVGFPCFHAFVLQSILHTAARNSIFSFYKSNTET